LRAGITTVVVAVMMTVSAAIRVSAHRSDEYLQAARIDIEPSRIDIELDLTPGIAIADAIIAAIDADRDGSLSAAERQAYISDVLRALDLRADGQVLRVEAVASEFPDIAELRRGDAAIRLRTAALVRLSSGRHHVSFRNAHRPEMSVYMANTLAPDDDRIAVAEQRRDPEQRELTVDYTVRAIAATRPAMWMFGGMAGLLLVAGVCVLRIRIRQQPRGRSRPSLAFDSVEEGRA